MGFSAAACSRLDRQGPLFGLVFSLALCLGVLVSPAAEARVVFPTTTTQATAGSPRMIAFERADAALADETLHARSSNPAVLEVLEPGRILEGETVGFVRVRGKQAGTSVLRLDDGSLLRVVVVPPQAGPLLRARSPKIVSPPAGAVVWGTLGVGVKWTDDLGTSDAASVRLVLPDGSRLEPVEHSEPGSDGWAAFDLNADAFPPGPLSLAITGLDTPDFPAPLGEPVQVVVARADSLERLEGEAEDVELPGPLPGRLGGDAKPNFIDDRGASGGKAFANQSPRPAFAAPLTLKEGGWYQAMARVRGVFSTGGFPALGFGVDAENDVRTAGASMGTRWHRIAVGPPVYLRPHDGKAASGDTEDRPEWLSDDQRLLSLRFVNDHGIRNQGAGGSRLPPENRALFIDSWEIARLPSAPGVALPATVDALPATRGDEPDRLLASLAPFPRGHRVSGGFVLTGQATAPEGPKNVVAQSLFLNGKKLQEQSGATAFFRIPAFALRPGENTLQLHARSGLAESASRELRIVAPAAAFPAEDNDRFSHRFAVDGGAWSTSDQSVNQNMPPRRIGSVRVAEWGFYSNAAAELQLPEALRGSFALTFEGRPQWFQGAPRFSAELVTPAGRTSLGEHPLRSAETSFGEVELPAGPKTLRIAYVNDLSERNGRRDRNLFLQAIRLDPAGAADQTPPAGEIRWPESGTRVGGFALLVIDAADAHGVTRARPLLDGKPAGPVVHIDPGEGRFLVPLVLRGHGGAHEVSVQLFDAANNRSVTPSVAVQIEGDRSPRLAEAVFVLNRLGFGPEPEHLADALVEGPRDWAIERLRTVDRSGPVQALARASGAFRRDDNNGHVARRGLAWLSATPDPLLARRVAFLDNHLTTWMPKAHSENQADSFGSLVESVDGPFFELLFASATSPAMLRYLDQQSSFIGRINENYAREILELHTVGVHGGYSQEDVTALAAVFTGLTAANVVDNRPILRRSRSAFAFVPSRHDPEAQRAFGLEIPAVGGGERPDGDAARNRGRQAVAPTGADDPVAAFDRIRRVIEALAAHPRTADFLADKLADHHLGAAEAGDEADGGVRDAMAAAFFEHEGRLPEVLAAMVEHPTFAAAMQRAAQEGPTAGARVARPLDAALRLQRVVGEVDPNSAARYLEGSGFSLFGRETPDGYPDEDAAYADSNATLQRWRYASSNAQRLVALIPPALRRPSAETRADASALADWRQEVVDLLAGRLTGGLLSETSNAAALSVLHQAQEEVGDADLQTVAALISQLPEGALR